MKRFKSPRHVQRFFSIHDQIANVFSCRRTQDTAASFHSARIQAFTAWSESPVLRWRHDRTCRLVALRPTVPVLIPQLTT
jgi:hypothetical protein